MIKAELMTHNEGFFTGARGKQIYYQAWLPTWDPKAILMIVHGLAEHSGRYMNLVDYFVPKNYAVYALDLVGHGKSEGTRAHVERFQDILDDLAAFHDIIKKEQPRKPVFLVGHSMGGLIASCYLLDHQDELAGAVLSASSVKIPDFVNPLTVFAGKVFSALVPKAGLLALEASHISRDHAVVDAYVSDPLVYIGKSTARLGAEMLDAIMRVSKEAEKITLPVTIVHGSNDKLANPDASQMLYDKVGSTDKTLKIYEEYYHEVFNDPGFEVVLGDVHTWLEKHLKTR
jgi:acylglycerol lipase